MATSDRDASGKLTYKALTQVFREGGTAIVDGRHVTRLEDLPTEAEYALGDEAAEAAALENLVQAQAAIEAQIKALNLRTKSTPAKDKGAK